MRCYYTYDKKCGKVLIPYCYSMLHSDDIRDCTCPLTESQFVRKEYNETVKELRSDNKFLVKENARLVRTLCSLRAKLAALKSLRAGGE